MSYGNDINWKISFPLLQEMIDIMDEVLASNPEDRQVFLAKMSLTSSEQNCALLMLRL